MSFTNTCRMTLHCITTTHLHFCSGKKQSLPNVFNFYFALVSYRYFPRMFLSHSPWLLSLPCSLPFTEIVQSATPTPSQLWIYVPLCSSPHHLCFCGILLSAQSLSPCCKLNSLIFPLFLVCIFFLPPQCFIWDMFSFFTFFLSLCKETLTLSIWIIQIVFHKAIPFVKLTFLNSKLNGPLGIPHYCGLKFLIC